jgi:homoserine dehydrogenase
LKVAIIGWGGVARRLASILVDSASGLCKDAAHRFEISGILRRSGAVCGVVDPVAPVFGAPMPVAEFLETCHADILVELSPLNPHSGEPSITHIRSALDRGMHVVTANKGPVAHAWRDLTAAAQASGVRFLHESAVMDGAPIFNLFRHNLPGVNLFGFTGVLNSTTTLVIEAMERGETFEEGIACARALGIAEENHTYDTAGWDAAAKTAALANVLMDAGVTPASVDREGIQGFSPARIRQLSTEGKTVRLVSRAETTPQGLRLSVRPEILDRSDLLASVSGTSNLLLFHTDRMGTIGTVSISPTVEQTAYGVYVDLLDLVRYPAL